MSDLQRPTTPTLSLLFGQARTRFDGSRLILVCLFVQPQAILPRLIKAAESRPGAELPDLPRIEQLIDTQTESDDITKQVQFQWIVKRCPEGRQPEPKELKVLTEEFQTKWKEPAFRRRFL